MRLAVGAATFVIGVAIGLEVAGIVDSDQVRFSTIFLSIATALLIIIQKVRNQPIAASVVTLILLLGVARGVLAGGEPVPDWNGVPADGESVIVTGWLSEDAGPAANGVRLTLQVESLRYGAEDPSPASFPLTVFTPGLIDSTSSGRSSDGFRYGDVYEVRGAFNVSSPEYASQSAGTMFAGFAYLTYQERGTPIRRWIAGIREEISGGADRVLNEPAASLASAMVVGDRTSLPANMVERFRKSGTAHILAISGMHLALVGGLTLIASALIFGRRRQLYLVSPSLVIWLYAALAGFSPSVTRAAIMFSVYLLARALGRQRSIIPALGLAAAVMVALSPNIVSSVSFQLSFAAMSGIAVLTPRLSALLSILRQKLFTRNDSVKPVQSPVATAIAISIAATAATWPIVAVNFGSAPIWGGVATLLIAPALPVFIVLSAGASLVGMASQTAGEIIGWPAWTVAEYMDGVSAFFAKAPPGPIETSGWGGIAVAAYFLALIAALEWRRVVTYVRLVPKASAILALTLDQRRLKRAPTWAFIAAIAIAALALNGAISASGEDELTVTFFQTDRGDMILVQTPNGSSALIDGGRHPLGAVRALDESLPFWDRSLDVVVLTHPDADHVGGLQAVLERYKVETIIEAPTPHRSSVYESWRQAVDAHGGSLTALPGTLIALDDGVTLEVISAGLPLADASINDASIVTMLRFGDFSMLLTGDITTLSERRLVSSGADLQANVLKVPHHGSSTSSSIEFLNAVGPTVLVAQVGDDNTFGHPEEETLIRLQSVVEEQNLFITSHNGDVTVKTNGERITVTAER